MILSLLSNPLVYLTLIALAVKILCAYRLRSNWRQSPEAAMCLAFLLLVYGQSVLELYGYYLWLNPHMNAVFIMKLYYAFFIMSVLSIPILIITIVKRSIDPVALALTLCLAGGVTVYILATDRVVAGVESIQYALTASKGEGYAVFQASSLAALLVTLIAPLRLYRKATSEHERVRSVNFLVGFIPYAVFVFVVILLMAFGVRLNIAGVSPIFMALFIYVLSENIRNDSILDLRQYFFWTEKAKIIREITRSLRRVAINDPKAKGMSVQYRQELVEFALRTFKRQKDAAEFLGVSRATMSRLYNNKQDSNLPPPA